MPRGCRKRVSRQGLEGTMNAKTFLLFVLLIPALVLSTGCVTPSGPASPSPPVTASLAQWQQLCNRDSCFCGSQDWSPDGPSEGSALRDDPWRSFLDETSPELVPLLLDRLDSTRMTSMHVCPFARATEGEMALYTVQHLLKVNWSEYDDRSNYCTAMSVGLAAHHSDRPIRGGSQAIVRLLLSNEEAREELKRFFLEKLQERRSDQDEERGPTEAARNR